MALFVRATDALGPMLATLTASLPLEGAASVPGIDDRIDGVFAACDHVPC
jgi:hypothetical protein